MRTAAIILEHPPIARGSVTRDGPKARSREQVGRRSARCLTRAAASSSFGAWAGVSIARRARDFVLKLAKVADTTLR